MSERSSQPEYRKLRRWLLTDDVWAFLKDAEFPLGRVADIHMQGMRLVSEKSIPLGEEFSCWMELPLRNGERERALFDVYSVWSRTNVGKGFSETGFRITDATLEAIEGIQKLIDDLRFEQSHTYCLSVSLLGPGCSAGAEPGSRLRSVAEHPEGAWP